MYFKIGCWLKPIFFIPDLVVWLNVTWSTLDTLTDDEVLAVVARNKKGASDPVVLNDVIFRDAAKRTGKSCFFFTNGAVFKQFMQLQVLPSPLLFGHFVRQWQSYNKSVCRLCSLVIKHFHLLAQKAPSKTWPSFLLLPQ